MEGNLWKWTNYWNGWQRRWFVLSENGVLSYYSSHEEVDQGCKGSMNVSACEIIVSQTDNTRLDVVVSHEKYLYLRAKDDKERQRWLVTLGSAKACVSKTNTHGRSRLSSTSPIPVPPTSCTQLTSNKNNDADKEAATRKTSLDMLKTKRSELRLYCDLLTQQVHTIKTAVKTPSESHETNNGVDLEKLNEGCSVLTQTCDTFIHALDETMKIASRMDTSSSHNGEASIITNTPDVDIPHASSAQDTEKRKLGRPVSFDGSTGLASIMESTNKTKSQERRRRSHSQKLENNNESHANPSSNKTEVSTIIDKSVLLSQNDGFMSVFGGDSGTLKPNHEIHFKSSISSFNENAHQLSSDIQLIDQHGMEHTLKPSFPMPSESTGIDSRQFILASQGAVKIFDFLGPKSFAPIRSEVSGHIIRIKTKFESNPMEFATLNDMVDVEIKSGVAEQNISASSSLLWLIRYLMFIHEFLRRFAESDINADTLIKDCLGNAYENCLRKFHTPVIHNVFSIALEASPEPRTFLDSLGRINTYNTDSTSFTKELAWTKRNDWRELFQVNLLPSLGTYLDTMEKCLMMLMKFYSTTGLSEKTKN